MSIRNRFRPCSRDSSSAKTKNGLGHQRETKLSNAVTENRACKSTLCTGITPSECSLSKEKSHRDPKQTVKNYIKRPREPQGYVMIVDILVQDNRVLNWLRYNRITQP